MEPAIRSGTGDTPVAPAVRGLVSRGALFWRIGTAGRVTVMSAPAGSGKTFLLRSWVGEAGLADRVAGVSVQREQRDPQRFWIAVADALRGTAAGSGLVRPLTAAPDLDGWAIVERLLEDLTGLKERVWLVIDDLHELGSAEAISQLELLVLRAPPQLRFVLASRHDVRLLEPVSLENAVVTADAARAQRETAECIAGSKDDGNRESDYFLFVKGNQPSLQKAIFDAIQHDGPGEPDHTEVDHGHGRIIRRSVWVAAAGDLDFPHAARVARIRRDGYDITGTLISKEIVHAVTSLAGGRASAAALAKIARGQRGIESVHWLRDTACAEDASTGCAGNGPQVTATLRNLAVGLLCLAGVTQITRTLQAIGRDRTRMLSYLPL